MKIFTKIKKEPWIRMHDLLPFVRLKISSLKFEFIDLTQSKIQLMYNISPFNLVNKFLTFQKTMGKSCVLHKPILIVSLLALCILVSPKQKQPVYRFNQKSHMIPHPDKADRGGQDAFYAGENLLVVADGVGGWNSQGVDPSKYSRFLCRAQVYYNQNPQFYNKNPIELMVKAQSKNNYIGSATMVVLTLDERQLRSCYIGDSGFIVIRVIDQKPLVIYHFSEQEHAFNFPYQLAMKKYNGDDPRKAICVAVDIQQGDIVVVGSDGLFDNIFVDQILVTVEDALISDDLFQLPQLFTQQAINRGQNDTFSSPFAQRAQDLGIDFTGGKLDDTTVIVAIIEKVKDEQKQKLQQL